MTTELAWSPIDKIFTGRPNPIPVVGIAVEVRRPKKAGIQADELAQIDGEGIKLSVFDKLEDEARRSNGLAQTLYTKGITFLGAKQQGDSLSATRHLPSSRAR